MKTFASTALLAAAGVANALSMTFDADVSLFKEWQDKHGKVYQSQNHEMDRFRIFKENLAYINAHNLNKEEHGFTLGLNHYADMTNEEYRQIHLSSEPLEMPEGESLVHIENILEKPQSVDWRKKGIVNDVKDQKTCGSCWAFSTVASVEGQYALKNKKLVSLSEQQLVDCSGKYGNQGCNGGLMANAFKYIKASDHGLDLESEYEYTAKDGTCKYDDIDTKVKPSATVGGFKTVEAGSEDALLDAVATVGPISIAIDASHMSFQFYESGVYYEKSCSSKRLDHGVAVVGYGSEDGNDYWIVRNSWGTKYGIKGYVRMARNKDNNCGVASMASYPIV